MTTNKRSLTELHALCREDYAKGQQQRTVPNLAPSYAARGPVLKPTDLDVAISVAQQLLDSDSVLSMREALRLLLRALGNEPVGVPEPLYGGDVDQFIANAYDSLADNDVDDEPSTDRCPAAHPDDPTSCDGPPVVTILDAANAGANGCEHHGARLLASLTGGRVYALGTSPEGCAIRVFKAAATIRPFAWTERGEGQ